MLAYDKKYQQQSNEADYILLNTAETQIIVRSTRQHSITRWSHQKLVEERGGA